MKKKTVIIIAAIIVVLAAAGVTAAVVVNNQDKKTDTQNNSSDEGSNNNATSNTFEPKNLNELSYVATSTTTVADQTITSTIESNGKGTTKTSSTTAGMSTESYITGNEVITCIDGACSKTTVETDATSDQLNADLSKYRNNATSAGNETIDGQSYKVWTVTGEAGDTIKYYLDNDNRIARITMTNSTIVYEYKDVSFTVPQV